MAEYSFQQDLDANLGLVPTEPMVTRTPFWTEAPDAVNVQIAEPNAWGRVRLADTWLPGVCTVRSSRARKAYRAGGPGDEQEEIIDTGAEASEVSISCSMWTRDHLARFEDFIEAIEMKGGSRADPKAVDVTHPGLNLLGIHRLYVTSISVPEPAGMPGMFQSMIQASEFKPKAKTKAKGKPTIIDASTGAIPIAFNPAKTTPADTQANP
jgi:hypothetical protein